MIEPRLHFHVEGVPQPQGSTRAFMVAGKPKITSDNARLKPWRKHIVTAAWEAIEATNWHIKVGGVAVTLDFQLPRPKTVTRRFPTVRPDIDKLTRAVLDALTTALVYADDSQVLHLTVTKHYADANRAPGVHISVIPLEGT